MPALARLTPFQGQDLSLLLRKRSIEVDRLARSGPGMDKNACALMRMATNIRDYNQGI